MDNDYSKENLSKIIKFYYYSLISSFSFSSLYSQRKEDINKLLGPIVVSNGMFADINLQLKALNNKPSFARFALLASSREIFSSIKEATIYNKKLLPNIEKDLSDMNKNFDGIITFLRNVYSHQISYMEEGDINLKEDDYKKLKKYRISNNLPLKMNLKLNDKTIEVSLEEIEKYNKLSDIIGMDCQYNIIYWCYNYFND
jgi:hypothetical protein